jgi:hypothetical protein
MHPYIPHLLADITAAHRTELPHPKNPKTIEEELEEIERWVEGEEPRHTFGYYCGLNAEEFPPAAQLTKKEMKLVCKAFRQMMFTWNLSIDLPDRLPLPIAYKMMVATLSSKTEIVNSGFMSFDFCTGYAPDCVFKEYCTCLKYWNGEEEINMPPSSSDELPF